MHALSLSELCDKIRDYYKVKYPNKRIFDEQGLIEDIESPSVRKDIVIHLFNDVVCNVAIFQVLELFFFCRALEKSRFK